MSKEVWEIFDPRNGKTLKTVRWKWQAKLICRYIPALDYDYEKL